MSDSGDREQDLQREREERERFWDAVVTETTAELALIDPEAAEQWLELARWERECDPNPPF